jgi:hypothetical protein
MVVVPGGDVIAGGGFITAGGVTANGIARYHPGTGTWSALGTGTTSSVVRALAVVPGGEVLVGGGFVSAGGNFTPNFARYAFGSTGPSISTQPSPQSACPNGTADFSVIANGGAPFTYQWQIESAPPSSNVWTNLASGPLLRNGQTIATVQDAQTATLRYTMFINDGVPIRSRCIVTNTCGSVTSDPATLTIQSCGGCSLADIAGGGDLGNLPDGTIDGTDFIAFVNSFGIGDATVDPAADVAGGGGDGLQPDGTIDGSDFIAFINAFAVGC